MKVKIRQLVVVGLVLLLVQGADAAEFSTGSSSQRLTAANLRRKSDASQSSTISVNETSRKVSTSVNLDNCENMSLNGGTSLMPEGFGDDEGSSKPAKGQMQKVLSAEGLAVKDNIKVEYGEGHGETADEALKEAMKDVLQKVVGVYVDSDFRMNNDKIIKDEIITHSNGFIDHYKKMEESDDPSGRGKVVAIKAWVKVRDFVSRMKKITPKQTVRVDGILLDTDISNMLNAETLLKNELGNLNPVMDLMEVGLVDSVRPVVISTTEEAVTLRYVFQIRYSKTKYYQEFIPRLSRILDQIAIAKPKNRDLMFVVDKVQLQPSLTDDDYPNGWAERTIPGHVLRSKNYWYGNLAGQREKPEKCVSAIVRITRGGVAQVLEWTLSKRLFDVYNRYRSEAFERCGATRCRLTLFDGDGKMLSQALGGVSRRFLMGDWDVQRTHVDCAPDYVPFARLWHFGVCKCGYDHMGSWTDRYVGCVDITVDREEVSKIKSAEVSLETNNDESSNRGEEYGDDFAG